jgi:membrane protease YdiL (CAAX protease family)
VEDKKIVVKAFSRIGFGYGAFIATTLLLQLGFGTFIAVLSMFNIQIPLGSWYVIVSSLANYVVGGAISYLIIRDLPVSQRTRFEKASAKTLLAGFLVCISALYIGNLMGLALMKVVSVLQGRPMVNPVEEILNGLSGWAIFLVMVVMAPVFEEILFRKVLIDRVRVYGDKAAIVVSGFIFGLSHGNFYQFFYAFLIGIVLAYIYIRTGKLRYTILFHMTINFIGSILGLKIQEVQWLIPIYSIIMLMAVAAGIVIFFQNRKNLIFQPGMKETWGKGSFKTLFLNFGMIFFFLFSTVTFVLSEIR